MAYERRISDWSAVVCSSDLRFDLHVGVAEGDGLGALRLLGDEADVPQVVCHGIGDLARRGEGDVGDGDAEAPGDRRRHVRRDALRIAVRTAAGHLKDLAEADADPHRAGPAEPGPEPKRAL